MRPVSAAVSELRMRLWFGHAGPFIQMIPFRYRMQLLRAAPYVQRQALRSHFRLRLFTAAGRAMPWQQLRTRTASTQSALSSLTRINIVPLIAQYAYRAKPAVPLWLPRPLLKVILNELS